jgi:hypothetical protein
LKIIGAEACNGEEAPMKKACNIAVAGLAVPITIGQPI